MLPQEQINDMNKVVGLELSSNLTLARIKTDLYQGYHYV